MKLFISLILTTVFVTTSRSSLFTDIRANVLSMVQGNQHEKAQHPIKRASHQFKSKTGRQYDDDQKSHFRLDPVLNFVRRSGSKDGDKDTSTDTSSSLELKDWKDEWREHWIQKKFEAINSSYMPGDTVNMIGARPWGVPCGDPNQHDMPWGTCMLPMECDAEYRIYRGDYNCGRTQFVCCALQLTAYDMYQGFEISFEDSGLVTDSNEKKQKGKGSKESIKKNRERQRRKREQARKRRKRQIQRQIDKIQKEIRKIINKQSRNASQARKKKTKQLKKFIEMLKKQYKKDRKAVQDIHETEMIKIDDALMKRLKEIMQMNQNFIRNATFRDIVVNGTLNINSARMLIEAYPDLESYININVKRRSGTPVQDYMDYDVEYGYLYY